MSGDYAEDQVNGAHGAEMTRLELARAAASSSRRDEDTPLTPVDAYTGSRERVTPGVRVVAGPVGEGRFHPSPSLDPKMIEAQIDGYLEDETGNIKPYAAPVVTAFSAATNALIDIYNARLQAQKDTSRTEANVILQVAAFAEKHSEKVTRKFDELGKALTKQIEALESSLTTPLKAAAERAGIAGELRAHFKGLTREERSKALEQAQREGQTEVLQAVLGAPAMLSGMTESERAIRTRIFNEAQAPQVTARLKALVKAKQLVEERGGLFITSIEKAIGADWKRINKLRAANSEAEKAFIVRDHFVDPTA